MLLGSVYTPMVREHVPKGDVDGKRISASYEEMVKECEAKVAQIVADCRGDNKKASGPILTWTTLVSFYILSQPNQTHRVILTVNKEPAMLYMMSRKEGYRQEDLFSGATSAITSI